jgi:hypothetical protein
MAKLAPGTTCLARYNGSDGQWWECTVKELVKEDEVQYYRLQYEEEPSAEERLYRRHLIVTLEEAGIANIGSHASNQAGTVSSDEEKEESDEERASGTDSDASGDGEEEEDIISDGEREDGGEEEPPPPKKRKVSKKKNKKPGKF